LGVGQGSSAKPRLIIMEYKGGAKDEKPIAFVGKGVTFDTGGVNIKSSDGMTDMHLDMSGGAAVIGAMSAIARLKLPINVCGLVPAAENMVSGESYRPGDILKSYSGKTIEVLNTDAEGRIILADAISYAKTKNPELIFDVATLTGAACVALGSRASGTFTQDENLSQFLSTVGEKSGDYVWPLPMWEEYEDEVRGTFGDVANLGKYGRAGGATSAAMFLWQFAKPNLWAHLDIAPTMTSIESDVLSKGATGTGVRIMVEIAKNWKQFKK
jgi:leucyl aminopeptidase